MIIDTHCHAGENWFEPVELLLHQMELNGVSKAVLVQHGGFYDNNYLLDAAAKHPGRFSIVALVEEGSPNASDDLQMWFERGAGGVRLRPNSPLKIWRKAAELDMVVSCRAETLDPEKLSEVISDLPSTIPVVLEHFMGARPEDVDTKDGYKRIRSLLKIAELPNVYAKLGGLGEISHRPEVLDTTFQFEFTPPIVEMILEAFGTSRTMWGSDYPPVSNREGYRNALHGIMDHPSIVDPQQRNQVMGITAASVFRFL
ncbi:MAG: amidohydrolase [SAR202 cluster bacterium]|nr:amidohydrolase [SAR202 cluster bacterium]